MNHIPQLQYNFILQNIPISCVDICILHDNKVLLVKRNEEPAINMWFPPGGRIYIGETIFEAAIRKCKEEVGLDIEPIKIIHTDNTIFKKDDEIIRHSLNVVVLAKPLTFEVKLNKYSSDFIWLPHITADLHPYVKKCLTGCGLN